MIHLTKAKGGYMVVSVAKNGETLSTSEILSSKKNAKLNMAAQLAEFDGWCCLFQDDTLPKQQLFVLYLSGNTIRSKAKPGKKYKQ